MSAQLTSPGQPTSNPEPAVVSGELRCTLTGRPLASDEAYWAPPVITARQLVTTVAQTLLNAPANLGTVLMGDLPNVPYAPEARQQLANRRTAEQLKLLVILLALAALLVVPIVMLTT